MHLPSTLNKAFVLVAYLMVLQVSGQQHSAGINTNNPNPNAVLHLVSTNGNQGLLIPQIGTTQRLSMDLSDPENNGLLVYDNDEGEFYYAHDGDWYSLTDDADADPSNEIQTLSKSGNTLTLSGNNSTVNIGEGTPAIGQFLEWDGTNWVPVTPPTGQQLQFAGNILSISNDPSMTTIDFSLWDQVASDDFSGDYNDLINLPALPTDLNELSDGSGLLFSGSFNDLSDVPVNLDTDFTDDFDGDYNSLINQPTIPTLTSDLTNDSGYITSPDDADADATNEIQTLTKSGNSIILSVNNSSVNIGEGTPGIGQFLEWDGANWVPVTPPSAQELQFAGNILSLSNDPSATTIDFSTWDLNASDDFDGDYNSLINIPGTFAPSAHNHTESEITDLAHYTDADIDGTEVAFANWDKDVTDDFDGDYNNLINIPGTFTPSAHNHTESEITDLAHYTDADIDGTEAAFTNWDKDVTDDFDGDYNNLINIPGTFAPSAHNHTESEITDLAHYTDADIDGTEAAFINWDKDVTDDFDGDYNNLINIPGTFTPSAHNHTESEITDLAHYTDADIDGTEVAFANWDKDVTDDFDGDYNSLINIPGTFAPSAHNHTESEITDLAHYTDADIDGTEVAFANWDKDVTDDFDGDYNSLINQPAIPTSTSDLVNDSGFITSPDDADANATNEIQDLSLAADHTLSLSLSAPTASLAPYMQTLSFTSPNLTISGVDGNTVDLSALNTDNQTVDLFDLTGNILSLSLEDDGAGPYTVDLSTFAIASQAGQNGNYLTTDGTNTSWDPLGALAQLDAVTTTEITDNTITGADLNASVAGNGLSGGGGAAIALNLSGTSGLEIVTDQLQMPEIHPGGTTFGGAGLVITSIDLDSKGRVLSTTTSVLISDRRLKKEISKIDNSLDKIASLNGYTYYLKTDSLNEDLQSGVMAQEIQDVYPHLIIDRPDGYMAVDYQGLIPILLEAIKEQNTIIKGLESKLESQESIITNQESRISGVEKKLDHLLQLGSITE
ncbi:MAG: tail fiber domain-containing protein [Cyclobacteriaceae bacterium]